LKKLRFLDLSERPKISETRDLINRRRLNLVPLNIYRNPKGILEFNVCIIVLLIRDLKTLAVSSGRIIKTW
jgi:hypothetical protein